ncbi:hypothetical protein BJ875DRAFT_367623, partial [Amylocarpus encephaloides]
DSIKTFCDEAAKQGVQDKDSGSLTRSYNSELQLGIDWPSGDPFPGKDDCNKYLSSLNTDCDGNDPANTFNWKHGGIYDIGNKIRYHVAPTKSKFIPGTCAFHLHEVEKFRGVDGPGTRRDHSFTVDVIAKDSKNNDLFKSGVKSAGDGAPYKMEGVYPQTLVFTPEARGDYIQFQYGDVGWQTRDEKKDDSRAWCNVGRWDGVYSPVGRDMDCFFPC